MEMNQTQWMNEIADLKGQLDDRAMDLDSFVVLICGVLVFFMQTGFAMLEAGAVQWFNVTNILFKNVMDASIASIGFYFIGYGLAFGKAGPENGFIGEGNFFLMGQSNDGKNLLYDDKGFGLWFFQWAFAATAATIVSGAVAERTKVGSYFIYATVMTTFIYPVVVHWIWDPSGWLSAHGETTIFAKSHNGPGGANGMIDFAGSCVVHVTGGFAGLIGAKIVGYRIGRFKAASGGGVTFRGHSSLLCSLGVAILWVGWYGFNCGSALAIVGKAEIVGKVAVTTTISASSAGVTATILSLLIKQDNVRVFNLNRCLNSVLGGLVAITAGCAVVELWGACLIGILAVFWYEAASMLLIKFRIDDPLNAFPVHGACGLWGTLAVGIFATDANVKLVYGWDNDAVASGNQFLIQLCGAVCTMTWSTVLCGILFSILKSLKILRIDPENEKHGLDIYEMGGHAYARENEQEAHYQDVRKTNTSNPNQGMEKTAIQMTDVGGHKGDDRKSVDYQVEGGPVETTR